MENIVPCQTDIQPVPEEPAADARVHSEHRLCGKDIDYPFGVISDVCVEFQFLRQVHVKSRIAIPHRVFQIHTIETAVVSRRINQAGGKVCRQIFVLIGQHQIDGIAVGAVDVYLCRACRLAERRRVRQSEIRAEHLRLSAGNRAVHRSRAGDGFGRRRTVTPTRRLDIDLPSRTAARHAVGRHHESVFLLLL